ASDDRTVDDDFELALISSGGVATTRSFQSRNHTGDLT
ncbi:unnamed protein product, partial [Allacma fusca]